MKSFDDAVIQYLFDGMTQPEISEALKNEGITPNSLSSIEKHLKLLKDVHGAKTMFHLGAILTLKKYIRK